MRGMETQEKQLKQEGKASEQRLGGSRVGKFEEH